MAEGQMGRVIERVRRSALLQHGAAMTDGQLLECFIAERDEAAFEALVRRHADMVLGVCRRVVGHAQDAEDAFQAAFVVLVRKAATVLPREAVGNWLYGVAYRTALEARARGARLRSREKQVKNLPETASRAASAAEAPLSDWCDLQPLLDRELSRLPDKYRLPVVLCDLEGRGRAEVSHQLQLAEGTLSSRLSRGRKMLAGRLARRGLAISAGALAAALAQQASAATAPPTLVISTIQAATMVAAGQAASSAMSASVAALTEGVLHAMFMTKVKTVTVVMMLIALAGSGAGWITHRALAEPGRTPDLAVVAGTESATAFGVREETPRMPPTFWGRVVAVSKDGKAITVETQSAGGVRDAPPTPAKTHDVKIGADTKIVYSNVGLGGAKLTEGYGAQVWIGDAKDVATQIHFQGKQADRHGANLSGMVAGVSKDGKTLSFKLAPQGRGEPQADVEVQMTDKTTVIYSNIGKGGAKPTEGYRAEVWLIEGSKSTASKVLFGGGVEKTGRDVPEAKADTAGRIVGVSKDGKVLTVEPPAVRGEEVVKHEIKVDDKTNLIYFQVGADGARPSEGYVARVWYAAGSKDTASKLHLQAPEQHDPMMRGKVVAIAKDAKAITVELSTRNRDDAPGSLEVKLSPKTKLVFNGVGPEGAVLSEGLGATVFLENGSKDTAAMIVLGPAAAGGR
jgi:RNA polymerase sigma factor (sigma-70 family)